MEGPATKRPFQQRQLDGFERSRIRHEVLRSKAKNLSSLKRRYATLVLGASLAVGGLGIPMKIARPQAGSEPAGKRTEQSSVLTQISHDLRVAQGIAREVTGGVTSAAETIASPLTNLARQEAPNEKLELVTEAMREEYFRTEVPFGSLIYKEARKNNLAPELVAAVVKTESQFRPTARSQAGAQGLMQLVPRTGRWMGAKNLMNPSENVKAGTKYLKYLEGRFDGDEVKMIAAYNAGEGNVRKFGGVPPFRETQNYMMRVQNSQRDFHDQVSGKVAELIEQEASHAEVAVTR